MLRLGLALLSLAVATATVAAQQNQTQPRDNAVGRQERDIFDYEAQKVAQGVKSIVFVADTDPHGPRGNHEFLAAAVFLARTINADYPNAYAVVHTKAKWPKDLKHADAVI